MSAAAAPQRTGARSSDLRPPSRLAAGPEGPQPHPLLALQRAFGNQLVQRHLLGDAVQLQPEMEVTRPHDEYEREADRVADTVMRMPDAAVARQVAEHERKKEEPKPPPAAKPPEVKPAPPPKPPEVKQEPPRPPEVKKEPPKTPAPDERKKKEAAGKVARKAAAASPPQQVAEPVAASIRSQQGGGQPLPGSERSFFEPRIGRNLSGVRIHDDPAAARTASELGARAFTHGQEVFFASGRYQPGTEAGRRLLAHELTHTIQQRGDSLGRLVQRSNGASAAQQTPPSQTATSAPTVTGGAGAPPAAGGAAQSLSLPALPVPAFRIEGERGTRYAQPFKRSHLYNDEARPGGDQRQDRLWDREMGPLVVDAIRAHLLARGGPDPGTPAGKVVFKSTATRPPRYWYGTVEEVAPLLARPQWNDQGRFVSEGMQVDHIFELQLSGYPDAGAANEHRIENFQLLNGSVNGSSGSQIDHAMDALIDQNLPPAVRSDPALSLANKNKRDAGVIVKQHFDLEFPRAVSNPNEQPATRAFNAERHLWTRDQIQGGVHLNHVDIAPWGEIFGQPGEVRTFPGATGGQPTSWTEDPAPTPAERTRKLAPIRVVRKNWRTGPDWNQSPDVLGELTIAVPASARANPPDSGEQAFTVKRIPGARYSGYMDKAQAKAKLRPFAVPKWSPVEIDDVDFGPAGLLVEGRIITDIPLLRGSPINFQLQGWELTFSKNFDLGSFTVPAPLKVLSTTLGVSATIPLDGSRPPSAAVDGRVDMEIQRVGRAWLEGRVGTAEGFSVGGGIQFDPRLFDGEVHLLYENRELSGGGSIRIGPGKVPGIGNALLTVNYAHERLDATGNAELTIPGLQRGTMDFHYSEATGIELGGRFELANNIPGIRSGSLEAHVRERPDHSGYAITATGTAQPAIPGVDSTLTIAYDDGAFTIAGHAAYSRGIVSGSIDLGATNRPVDPDGNAIPNAPPGDHLTAYGRGQATVRLTPWLQGTVGIQLRPNGELVLSGEVALPDTVDVFPAKNYTRNITTIGLDIPIIGVAAFGQRIGIFATIQGGLDFDAGVGPGRLRQLRLGITYEPAHEERTHVTGDGEFVIPAHAGLRLFIRGGAGAGIPVVSATVGIEVGGALGLEGAAQAGVHIDWTPTRGLVLDARGEIYVEPKFHFDVSLFALVEASAFGLHYEFYNRRWVLAAIEYGSGLRLGMAFPIHYEEGRPFELDWNQVQFQVPDVNPREVLTGLIERITA